MDDKIADETPYMQFIRVLTALSVLSLLSHGFQFLTSYIHVDLRNHLHLNIMFFVLAWSSQTPPHGDQEMLLYDWFKVLRV